MQSMEMKNTEDILVEAGLLSPGRLQEIKAIESRTGEKIEKILLSEGVINYKNTLEIRAKKMGVEFIDLENIYINKSAVSVLKPEIAVKYSVLPFDIKNNLVFLAMLSPDDIFLIDEIKVFTQMEIKPFLADSRLLNRAIRYFYGTAEQEVIEINESMNEQETIKGNAHEAVDMPEMHAFSNIAEEPETANIDGYVGDVLLKALNINCSDIHIDSMGGKLRVRYRVDGVLIEDHTGYTMAYDEFVLKIKNMAGLLASDNHVPQKGRISHGISHGAKMDMEVLVLPVSGGEKLLIKPESNPCYMGMEELGMSEREQRQIINILDKRSGMVIITGIKGSGKTTTCYAMLKKVLSGELNIITLEKKITQRIDGISQIQLQHKPGRTGLEFVKSIIAHDPDVILADIDLSMTGEQDKDMLRELMNTALEGKLVLVTMNYPGVLETVSGLACSGFEKYMVFASIEGIIAQHMVRKVCSKCRNRKCESNDQTVAEEADKKYGKKTQCSACNDTGYKGKAGIFEVFPMNKEYRRLIAKDDSLEMFEKSMEREYGSFRNNCIKLINDNITTVEEIIRIGAGRSVLNS